VRICITQIPTLPPLCVTPDSERIAGDQPWRSTPLCETHDSEIGESRGSSLQKPSWIQTGNGQVSLVLGTSQICDLVFWSKALLVQASLFLHLCLQVILACLLGEHANPLDLYWVKSRTQLLESWRTEEPSLESWRTVQNSSIQDWSLGEQINSILGVLSASSKWL
jgi:hypothetical protein